ncbi:insulin-like growth factor-binding protein 2 [Hemiscyllium ocellatum]|uniref:insulin-like growth factor-binding protein 2 n=1 Tax=Hemiscyllium ocellatum TaxID=170820 RepID=UPI002965FBDE|nr:insulin-like growth factor-binding protein 2 [Hemiscyllium ocellatum]
MGLCGILLCGGGVTLPLLVSLGLGLLLADEVAFRCPPCGLEQLSGCPTPAGCRETVREPGCGCCWSCARALGEPCGVYTPRCGAGLRCYPRTDTEYPLQDLVQGQGLCGRRRDLEYNRSRDSHSGGERQEEHLSPELIDNHLNYPNTSVMGRKPVRVGSKTTAVIRERNNAQWRSMDRGNKGSEEPRRTWPQLTTCQVELDQVLERISSLRLPDERGPLEHLYSLHIPNCDWRGLYNLKQCKTSLNGQRGECWCVNPHTGKAIPGTPRVRGDPECHRCCASLEQNTDPQPQAAA